MNINFFYNHKKDFLISFDESYVFFFSEYQDESKEHLFKDYFLNLHNYSICIELKAKWLNWGLFFFTKLSYNLNNFNYSIYHKNSIQKDINFPEKKSHVLLINNIVVSDAMIIDFLENLKENDTLFFELKVNIDEYLLLTGFLVPEIAKCDLTQFNKLNIKNTL